MASKMMTLLSLLLLSATSVLAGADWHFLYFKPTSGISFTSFSGRMTVPKLPHAGVYYVWPGLQPTDGSGVYQNVLDGRSGRWWFGSGWVGTGLSLPWGGGFNADEGDQVLFNNTLLYNSTWQTTISKVGSNTTVTNQFVLTGKTFNQALLAIELYGQSWNFGAVNYSDVSIISTGKTTSWCTSTPGNYLSATNYKVLNHRATVTSTGVTCNFDLINMINPTNGG